MPGTEGADARIERLGPLLVEVKPGLNPHNMTIIISLFHKRKSGNILTFCFLKEHSTCVILAVLLASVNHNETGSSHFLVLRNVLRII